jgi:hypothetical protein
MTKAENKSIDSKSVHVTFNTGSKSKSNFICYENARMKESLTYSLRSIIIPKAKSCKYLEIILYSDLRRANQVRYFVKRVWKALHCTMCILKKGNSNNKA